MSHHHNFQIKNINCTLQKIKSDKSYESEDYLRITNQNKNQASLIENLKNENNQKIEIWGTDVNSIIYTCILQVFLIFLIIKTFYAKSKEDFSFISRLSKIIMIIGIVSIIIFTKNFI